MYKSLHSFGNGNTVLVCQPAPSETSNRKIRMFQVGGPFKAIFTRAALYEVIRDIPSDVHGHQTNMINEWIKREQREHVLDDMSDPQYIVPRAFFKLTAIDRLNMIEIGGDFQTALNVQELSRMLREFAEEALWKRQGEAINKASHSPASKDTMSIQA